MLSYYIREALNSLFLASGTGKEGILVYVGSMFAPISLLGLLCKGSVTAAVAPATSVSVIVPVYN